MVRRFCQELEDRGQRAGRRIVAMVVDCGQFRSSRAVMRQVLGTKSGSVAELLEVQKKRLVKGRGYLVVVQDKADTLFRLL